MADHHNDKGLFTPPDVASESFPSSPSPSYSSWRTGAHLYFPFVTVVLFMTLGSPFESTQANILCVIFSAIPTNLAASLVYPTDRPEPTPKEAVRFSRKSDIYRAAILFTYRWLFGTPFNLYFFIIDFMMTYPFGSLIGERPASAKQRRSEFGVHLLWAAGSAALVFIAPSFLSFGANLADRVIWRVTYIALVDDIVGALSRPNLKTWKGKARLVLTQAFVILFTCWLLLSWKRDMILAYQNDEEYQAALAALKVQQDSIEAEEPFEDDGDRFLREL
ncbi:hypothetical protein SVAN01_09705 [Stagonosporopsis vannaccii]|nr:hypothetical protein SVAN01_09705 [Stagonosporopsis vannaccii]